MGVGVGGTGVGVGVGGTGLGVGGMGVGVGDGGAGVGDISIAMAIGVRVGVGWAGDLQAVSRTKSIKDKAHNLFLIRISSHFGVGAHRTP